jgi:hypothetical protein
MRRKTELEFSDLQMCNISHPSSVFFTKKKSALPGVGPRSEVIRVTRPHQKKEKKSAIILLLPLKINLYFVLVV